MSSGFGAGAVAGVVEVAGATVVVADVASKLAVGILVVGVVVVEQ